jgi:hypothetical protein
MVLTKNQAPVDRAARGLAGFALVVVGVLDLVPEPWDTGLEVLAWGLLLMAVLGWCPFYALLGRGTRRRPG